MIWLLQSARFSFREVDSHDVTRYSLLLVTLAKNLDTSL